MKALVILVFVASLMAVVFMHFRVRELNNTLKDTIANYEHRITKIEDQLKMSEAERDDIRRLFPGLNDAEEDIFRRRGLDDPTGYIIRDMEKRKELMPLLGVFGARPSFYVKARSYLINGQWAYYSITDGGWTGESLLSYSVDDTGAISWRVVDTVVRNMHGLNVETDR